VLGAALSPSYIGFTVCRTLQGLFNTAPQVIGLSMIHDMFFFHERARKVNLWAFSFLCGPFLGAFISALLVQKLSWRAVFGILAGLHGLSILVIILFGEETLSDRPEMQVAITRVAIDNKSRGKFLRLIGHRSSLCAKPAMMQLLVNIVRIGILPQLLLPTAVFTSVNFMWAIGIITTITQFVKPPPYMFSDLATALIYLAPFTGVMVAEVWGHFFNDFLPNRYMRRHNGVHHAENRLWAVYPAVGISIVGLVIYGQTLEHELHWTGLAFGWGFIAAGFLAATTAIEAYALDCFPNHSAVAASWINFWRTTGENIDFRVSC
jgi:MFS family permease